MAVLENKIITTADGAKRDLTDVVNILGRIEGAIGGIREALDPMTSATKSVSRAVNRLAGDIEKINPDKFGKMASGLNDVSKAADTASDKLAHVGDGIEVSEQKVSSAVSSMAEELSSSTKKFSDISTSDFMAMVEYIRQSREETTALVPVMSQAAAEAERFATITQNAFMMDMGQMGTSFDYFAKQLPTVISDISAIQSIAEEAGQRLVGMFEQPMIEIKNFVPMLKDMSQSVEDNIIDVPYREVSSTAEEAANAMKSVGLATNDMADSVKNANTATEDLSKTVEKIQSAARPVSAKSLFEDIEKEAREGVNEVQLLIDRINAYKKIISMTDSGSILFDRKYYEAASKALPELENKLKAYKNSLKDVPQLSGEVTKPIKEVKTPKNDSLKWMAEIIAVQHELEKLSGMFSRMGDIAKNAFLKCLLPLKLVQHQFEEMKSSITHIGSAFAMMFRPLTKVYSQLSALGKRIRETFSAKAVMSKFANVVGKAFDSLVKKWQKVMQRFSFTLLRKAINAVINELNDAMKSLALFSKGIGTDFNDSMTLITSDFRYLAASIMAMLEPLINYFAPILDGLVDKLVNVINHVNMFIAALSGAKTFTIAKKKIIDYSKAIEEANKKAKQLTMGIDELNILNDDKSADELSDLFDWEEIATPKIDFGIFDSDIMQLVKKILGQIKDLLKAIWDAVRAAWDRVREYVLSAIKRLVKAALQLLSDILRDLIKLFKEAKTVELLETIMRICGDLINVIAAIIEKIDEAWNHNQLGLKILEKIRDILLTIAKHVQNVTAYMVKWAESLNFVPLFEAFLELLTKIEYAVDQIGYVFEDLAKLVLDLLKYVIEKALPELLKFQGDIIHGLGNIAKNIHEAWTELDYGKVLFNDITGIVDTLLEHIRNIGKSFDGWTVNLDFKPFMNAFDGLLQSIKPLIDGIGKLFEDMLNDVILPLVQYALEKAAPQILGFISDIIQGFANVADGIHGAWTELEFGEDLFKNLTDIIDNVLEHVRNIGKAFKEWAKELDFEPIMKSFNNLLKSLKPVTDAAGGIFEDFVNKVVLPPFKRLIEEELPKTADAIAHFADAINWDNVRNRIGQLFEAFDNVSKSIGEGVIQFVDDMGQALAKFGQSEAFQTFLDNLINFMNRISPEMVTKVLDGIGMAIIKIAEAVAKFVNSDMVQNFLDGLIKFINNSSVDKIANIIMEIAKAFIMFKGISVATGALSKLLSFLPMITELGALLGTNGVLVAGIGAAILAFSAFGDTIQSIDWSGILTSIYDGILALIQNIDWQKVGETFGYLLAEILKFGIKTFLNPAWRAEVHLIVFQAIFDAFSGIVEGITEFVANMFESIGFDGLAGLVRGFKNMWDTVFGWIHDFFQSLIDFVKNILGIHSPSTIFEEIGVNLVLGLINGIMETWETLIAFFTTAFDAIYAAFTEAWAVIHNLLSVVWQGIYETAVTIWTGISEFFTSVFTGISETFSAIWAEIQTVLSTAWTTIVNLASELWGGFKEFFLTLWDNVQTVVSGVWNYLNELLTGIWNGLKTLAEEVFNFIHDTLINAWNNIRETTETVWSFVRDLVIGIWNEFKNTVGEIFEFIKNAILGAWETIKNESSQIWNAIKGALEEIWNNLKSAAEYIFGLIKDLLVGIWNTVKDTWLAIWDGIKTAIEAIWNEFIRIAHEVFDGISQFFEVIWDNIAETWSRIWNGIITTISELWNTFVNTLHNIWDNVAKFFEGLWDGVQKTWESVWTNIGNFIKGIVNGILGYVEGIVNGVVGGVNKIIGLLNNLHIDIPDNPFTGAFTLGFSLPEIPKLNIPRFAVGGFPEDGLFMANSGELVGQFSNGRTAVVNNQQIEAGISQAVSSVLAPYLEQIARNTGVVAEKDFTVDIDSREIARANDRGRSSLGRSLTSLS